MLRFLTLLNGVLQTALTDLLFSMLRICICKKSSISLCLQNKYLDLSKFIYFDRHLISFKRIVDQTKKEIILNKKFKHTLCYLHGRS